MIDIVENFLDKYGLKNQDKTLLVGFSGGCDSLCLLDILSKLSKKYGFKVIALHLNHNWRPEESLLEEQNCKDYCEKNKIEFISETMEYSEQKTESVARDARYAFFLKHAKSYPNSSLATGHTSSDNAETIIYRIIKGTGVVGIRGILPERKLVDLQVVRPLLSISRSQTEDYCHSIGLSPNNDSSNLDLNYKRNFIRHKIMPLFKEINFHAEKSINSLAQMAISQTNIVNEYMEHINKEVFSGNKILTAKFRLLSDDVMKQLLHTECLKYNLEYDTKKISNVLEFIKENFDSKSGSRYSITSGLWLFANSKSIYLITHTKGEGSEREIVIANEGKWEFENGKVFTLEKYKGENNITYPAENDSFAYVNLNNIGLNLTLRTRRDGDYISPFGMSGKMKLKKYLNSKGISQHKKDGLVLLCKGSEVLWVARIGLSNKLKVENTPTHVIRLEKE